MNKMNKISIDYIDGYLSCLSDGCHAMDYVPFYGAESFSNNSDTILESLKKHFGISQSSINHRKLDNFEEFHNTEVDDHLEPLVNKWVDDKYFDGELNKLKNGSTFLNAYKDNLWEQVYFLAGSTFKGFIARLEHEEYEYDCQLIGFVGDKNAFYIYFGYSD